MLASLVISILVGQIMSSFPPSNFASFDLVKYHKDHLEYTSTSAPSSSPVPVTLGISGLIGFSSSGAPSVLRFGCCSPLRCRRRQIACCGTSSSSEY
ncbi:hypothetical protein B0T13DRAFT_168589 [Neurospora crassa]|nr:hypothetical protein B0T13DRAFT_168589 [Neurospora crassa]